MIRVLRERSVLLLVASDQSTVPDSLEGRDSGRTWPRK